MARQSPEHLSTTFLTAAADDIQPPTQMAPPRRQQPTTATTTFQTTTSTTVYLPQSQSEQVRPSGSQTPQPPSLGMTPASRYISNLKVLRRRDPSILSIFDQFSHVCVYHHDGQKWDKHGYEGSMFLFERESYPPYGFYIMNRVGMEEYIQPLHPEDDIVHSGKFVIIRSYPDFLNNRLSSIKSEHPGETLDKFSDVYAIPNIDQIDSKTKGRSIVVGLWMHTDDSRDSLIDVLKRLHSYIKQNLPYPDEYRYGPGRPPPPHRLRAVARRTAGSTSDTGGNLTQSDGENDQSYYSDAPAPSNANGDLSALDKLFSKLGPSPSAPPFAHSSKAQTPSTGLSLLNDIFASASSTPAPSTSITASNPTITQSTTIFAPQPSINSTGPQILNSQVLTTILTGSTPSRAASVASIVSHPSSREGDNEDDSQSDSPHTVLDEDSDYQRSLAIHQPTGGSTAARLAGADLLNTFGFGIAKSQPKINGDVTPRPPPNGAHHAPVPIQSTASVMTIKGSDYATTSLPIPPSEPAQKPRANRPLVPFESDSELWPYNHKPVNENSSTTDDDDESEIVELNFEETSVLSDPEAFKRVLKEKRSAVSLRGSPSTNGIAQRGPNGAVASPEKGKARNRRRTKKELRDAQDKAEIEKGWDQPIVSHTRGLGMEAVFGNHHASSSPSPSPSPAISATRERAPTVLASEMKTPTMTAKTMPLTNGPAVVGNLTKGKGKLANGHAKVNGHASSGGVDPEVVKDSMIAALEGQPQPVRVTDKNEFMREIAMLIHTDKAFAERLYQEYIARHV